MERPATGHDIPGQISTKYPHTTWDIVYPISTNCRWILLPCLGMWYVNKRIAAESQHAQRQTVTSVYKTDWTENEQEWEGILNGYTTQSNYYSAKNILFYCK